MSNIIDSIQLSGTVYTLSAQTSGGGSITIDPTLDSGSTNPVANSAITTAINTISEALSGKTNESDFSAHTANTQIHVTTAQTASWDAKSNFSGSYNDLTNKPTIPATTSAVTSGSTDAITSGGVYAQMGGFKLLQITQADYDSLVQGGTVDPNTIYYIVN